jgi:hypothetical protein
MKKLLKFAVFSLAALVLAAILSLLSYNLLVFQPVRAEVPAILSSANSENRHPPQNVQRFIYAAHSRSYSVTAFVGRELSERAALPRAGVIVRIGRWVAWDLFVRMHLTDEEVMGLYASLCFNGEGAGLNDVSMRLFAKSLSSLNDVEAATVVAFLKAPGMYKRDPSLLQKSRDQLLNAVAGGP